MAMTTSLSLSGKLVNTKPAPGRELRCLEVLQNAQQEMEQVRHRGRNFATHKTR
jgi:hypothetical protein